MVGDFRNIAGIHVQEIGSPLEPQPTDKVPGGTIRQSNELSMQLCPAEPDFPAEVIDPKPFVAHVPVDDLHCFLKEPLVHGGNKEFSRP
jgi:hypothetical protein